MMSLPLWYTTKPACFIYAEGTTGATPPRSLCVVFFMLISSAWNPIAAARRCSAQGWHHAGRRSALAPSPRSPNTPIRGQLRANWLLQTDLTCSSVYASPAMRLVTFPECTQPDSQWPLSDYKLYGCLLWTRTWWSALSGTIITG